MMAHGYFCGSDMSKQLEDLRYIPSHKHTSGDVGTFCLADRRERRDSLCPSHRRWKSRTCQAPRYYKSHDLQQRRCGTLPLLLLAQIVSSQNLAYTFRSPLPAASGQVPQYARLSRPTPPALHLLFELVELGQATCSTPARLSHLSLSGARSCTAASSFCSFWNLSLPRHLNATPNIFAKFGQLLLLPQLVHQLREVALRLHGPGTGSDPSSTTSAFSAASQDRQAARVRCVSQATSLQRSTRRTARRLSGSRPSLPGSPSLGLCTLHGASPALTAGKGRLPAPEQGLRIGTASKEVRGTALLCSQCSQLTSQRCSQLISYIGPSACDSLSHGS